MTLTRTSELICHPATPATAVTAIHATVTRSAADLAVRFRLEGSIAELRIPAPMRPRFAMRLWEHTCFEAFVAIAGETPYRELNLSPSGEWAAHGFRNYRDGGPLDDETLDPEIACRADEKGLELEARIVLDRDQGSTPLEVALTAVIEHRDATLSYWALRHPHERPDFHDRRGFALRMEAP